MVSSDGKQRPKAGSEMGYREMLPAGEMGFLDMAGYPETGRKQAVSDYGSEVRFHPLRIRHAARSRCSEPSR
jgi:hypothetical protein